MTKPIIDSPSSSNPSIIQQRSEWISVDYEKPKSVKYPTQLEDCNILIAGEVRTMLGFYCNDKFFAFEDMDECGNYEYSLSNIKYWMELPKPPIE